MKAKIYYGECQGRDGRWLLVNQRVKPLKLHLPIRLDDDDERLDGTVYRLDREAWSESKASRGVRGGTIAALPGPVVLPDGLRASRRFYETIYPLIAGRTEALARTYLGLYWRLGLEGQPRLLGAVNRLLCFFEPEIVAAWLKLIVGRPVDVQYVVCTLLVETELAKQNPGALDERIETDLDWIVEVGAEKNDCLRWFYLYFRGLERGCSSVYLRAGLKLTRESKNPGLLRAFAPCSDFTHETEYALRDLCRLIQDPDSKIGYRVAADLWAACALSAGLVQVLEQGDFQGLSAEQARALLKLYGEMAGWSDFRADPDCFRRFFRARHPRLRAGFAAAAPGYASKYRDLMEDYWASYQGRSPAEESVEEFCLLAGRLSRPPFSKFEAPSVSILMRLSRPDARDVPDSSFRKLERALRSDTGWELTMPGIRSLLAFQPDFTRRTFRHFPRKLLAVARLLGSLKTPARSRAIRRALKAPLLQSLLDELEIKAACLAVMRALKDEPELTSPIHKTLRAFVLEGAELSSPRREYYERNFRRDLEFTRLELLERTARRSLAELYPGRGEAADLHSLQMYSLLTTNRKPLRKFLKIRDPNASYLLEHPRSRAWLGRHAGFDQNLWLEGLRSIRRTEAGETLTLAPETRTDEILKMGTYVNSCLALGGIHMHNPASVLLDVNKQVVFARDERGRFVARQLLAVSEENRLVCYEVYPCDTDERILRAFSEYDRTLARALGLPLYDDYDYVYTIECILSEHFYDDSPWDLKV